MIVSERISRINGNLLNFGVDLSVSSEQYLDTLEWNFRSAKEMAERAIILSAIIYICHFPDDANDVKAWLEKENLMDKLSHEEEFFIDGRYNKLMERARLSWRTESLAILLWSIKKTKTLIAPNKLADLQSFEEYLPGIGESTKEFIESAEIRNIEYILDLNIFYELIALYFSMNPTKAEEHLNYRVCHERHRCLNWIRNFDFSDDWDNISTDV